MNSISIMIKLFLYKHGYVRKDFVKRQLEFVINDIQFEIEKNSQYQNVGKRGCITRIQKVIDLL